MEARDQKAARPQGGEVSIVEGHYEAGVVVWDDHASRIQSTNNPARLGDLATWMFGEAESASKEDGLPRKVVIEDTLEVHHNERVVPGRLPEPLRSPEVV